MRQFLLLCFLLFPSSCLGWAAASARKIPITVISGFLGSGKTTLLQNILHNSQGLRIAVVVNDVAAVNIDSKLVQGNNEAAGIVELQNGCACCSKSEELLASVAELVTLSDLRGDEDAFHHIVVEMSGIGDPKGVRAKFQEAVFYDMPLMDRVILDTMVTLVDCTPESFMDYLKSSKIASTEETPELYYRDNEEDALADVKELEGIPSSLLEVLGASQPPAGSVADLLVSQAEIADLVLLNKVDLAAEDYISRVQDIVRAVNPKATVLRSKFGEIPLSDVLGVARGEGVVMSGIVDDHKDALLAAAKTEGGDTDSSHSHTHDHSSDGHHITDDSSGHSHSHDHACEDPECTDTSHSHSHDHGASTHAGIGAFVYRARRPLHPARLASFLRQLPVSRGLPDDQGPAMNVDDETKRAMKNVVRSKGFTWCADSHAAAMYWSQSGSNYELNVLGSWWATLDRSQWPEEAVEGILQDFDDPDHREQQEDLTSVGDRRQEIVFIGPGLGMSSNQDLLRRALDKCLLDDAEFAVYAELRSKKKELEGRFPNPFTTNVMAF